MRYFHKPGTIVFSMQSPLYKSNLTLLSWFLLDFAYLSMLFILEMVCNAGSADHLKNKYYAQISKLCGNGG